jgi:hypothetical protein
MFLYYGYFRKSAVERIFSKTSAKQLGRARSGDRTSLSQVCLEEETGNRQWWNSEQTHRDIVTAQDPSGVPTAQVGEVKL